MLIDKAIYIYLLCWRAYFADLDDPCYKQTLPFQKVVHQVSTLDAQPSNNGGILVMVTGALLVCTLLFQIRVLLEARFANFELLFRSFRSMRSNGP